MNPAAWAWVGLAVLVTAYVVAFDVWAHFANAQSMSGRFHEWLHGAVSGPAIFAVWGGLFIGLTYHFFTTRNQ